MGSVGNELTALALGGLQPFRQVVEFLPQHGQLVAAAHVHLVGIIPLPDNAHGGHDPVQTSGKGVGKGDGKGGDDDFQHQGDAKQGLLQGFDQRALGGIVLRHVYAAHHGAIVDDGGRRPGVGDAVVVRPGKDVVPLRGLFADGERLQNLRKQDIGTHGSAAAVVQRRTAVVGDHKPRDLQAFQLVDDAGDGGAVQHLQSGNFVGGQQTFFNHGGFLALVEQLMADAGAVDIQKNQHHQRDRHIGHGIPELGVAVAPKNGFFICGNNSQRPTSLKCISVPPDFPPASPADGGYARPRCGCHCGIRMPRWCPAALPGNRPGWDCA